MKERMGREAVKWLRENVSRFVGVTDTWIRV